MQYVIPDIVKKSRSIRRFDESRRIPEDILVELVDIARFCPSARNRQPLRYVIASSPGDTARIRSCVLWALDLPKWDGPAIGERPTGYIIIVTEQDCIPNPCTDIGIAAQTMMLAAAERGFGGCMMGSILKKELREVLGIPGEYEIHLVLAFGYPAEKVIIDPIPEDGNTRYWRDSHDVHHVPKRSFGNVLI